MAQINIELTEKDVKELILAHIKDLVNVHDFDPKKVNIQVKSAQNYKAEWETAKIKATYQSEV